MNRVYYVFGQGNFEWWSKHDRLWKASKEARTTFPPRFEPVLIIDATALVTQCAI